MVDWKLTPGNIKSDLLESVAQKQYSCHDFIFHYMIIELYHMHSYWVFVSFLSDYAWKGLLALCNGGEEHNNSMDK